ncbi:hypothetical protein [Sphingomonas sp. S-NIH.Pt15_0812]|uniref:hypothetical protein n=1 Tax=Sphingomonas sp. S-NIH.Pt15_0812 TaxID=1920129 RepID=UPI0019D0B9F7|nr:hypothetical protein [Sphingomonas sp. S-NIH.Pt15_0812]
MSHRWYCFAAMSAIAHALFVAGRQAAPGSHCCLVIQRHVIGWAINGVLINADAMTISLGNMAERYVIYRSATIMLNY